MYWFLKKVKLIVKTDSNNLEKKVINFIFGNLLKLKKNENEKNCIFYCCYCNNIM